MQRKNISAAPGQPSTFWSTDGEHWYRTKAEAEQNNIYNAVNPADYEITKSVWKSKKTYFIIGGIIILLVIGIYGYKKGWFNKLIKH